MALRRAPRHVVALEMARDAYLSKTRARSLAQPMGKRMQSIMICARLQVAGSGRFPSEADIRAWLGRDIDRYDLRGSLGSLVVRGLIVKDGDTYQITDEGWK